MRRPVAHVPRRARGAAKLRRRGGPAVRYARERFGDTAVEPMKLSSEELETTDLTLTGPADAWTVSFALSFGGAAALLGPPCLREQLHDKLAAALALYQW